MEEFEISEQVPNPNTKAARATEEASITRIVEELDSRSLTELMMAIAPQERRKGHCIILYLPEMRDPIELWNQTHITLGRRDHSLNVQPTIDLAEHHGTQLGVSRLHAEIIYSDSGYFVRDLGSRNGTWVNKTRVVLENKVEITHRDTLRLGHFMIQVGSCQYS